MRGIENGSECLEYPYDHLETKIKSPTRRFGFIEPEGMLKGSAINERISKAIKTAIPTDFKLLKKLSFFFSIYNYTCNCVFFFIT